MCIPGMLTPPVKDGAAPGPAWPVTSTHLGPFTGVCLRAVVGLWQGCVFLSGCWLCQVEQGWFLCVLHLQVAPSFRARRCLLPSGYGEGLRTCPALYRASKARAGLCALTQVSTGPGNAPQQRAGAGTRQVLRLPCVLLNVSLSSQLPVPKGCGAGTCSFSATFVVLIT